MIDGLVSRNETKIVFLVLDGLGDIPDAAEGVTPLESAKKPNIDRLAAERGILGRLVPVEIGITPGSGPGHLSLFGYDPSRYEIGRGILEVLGLEMDLKEGDVAARGNFCTVREGIVVDRRAGRLETEETERLCEKISRSLSSFEGMEIVLRPGKSHRFGIIFRGEGLSDALTDADPHRDRMPFTFVSPRNDEAKETARKVNLFLTEAMRLLEHEKRGNGILLRGFSKRPEMPSFYERYSMKAVAFCSYPMYRGIAKLLGMDVTESPKDYEEMVTGLKRYYGDYNFFFLHVKETDLAGEDGDFDRKRRVIEQIDRLIPEIVALDPQVMVITGDHSTPCMLRGHSWHPVPLLLLTKTGERDGLSFGERHCLLGSVGTIYGRNLMNLVLAHASRLDKFGA